MTRRHTASVVVEAPDERHHAPTNSKHDAVKIMLATHSIMLAIHNIMLATHSIMHAPARSMLAIHSIMHAPGRSMHGMHNVTHAPAQRIIAPHRIKHEDASSMYAAGEASRNVAWDRRLALAPRVRIGGRGCASGWGEAVSVVHRGG
jgi:hypothetical protein